MCAPHLSPIIPWYLFSIILIESWMFGASSTIITMTRMLFFPKSLKTSSIWLKITSHGYSYRIGQLFPNIGFLPADTGRVTYRGFCLPIEKWKKTKNNFFIKHVLVGLDRTTSRVIPKFLTTAQPKLADYFCRRLLTVRSIMRKINIWKKYPRLELGSLVLDSDIQPLCQDRSGPMFLEPAKNTMPICAVNMNGQ